MSQTSHCDHSRTRLIAQDKDATYIECLVCGAILEAGELPDSKRFDEPEAKESLSDA